MGLVAGIAVFLTASSFSTINRYIDLQSSESSYYKILNLQEEGTMYMETALGFVLEWAVNNTAGYGGLNNETARKEWLDENYDVKKKEAEIPVPKGVDVPICQTCDPATEMFDYLKMIKSGGGGDTTTGDTGDCLKAKPNADGFIKLPDSKYYTHDGADREGTTPALCVVLYRATKDYYEKFNGDKVYLGDVSPLNACGTDFPPHATHQCGEDVDISGGGCCSIYSSNQERSVFLAEALIKHMDELKSAKAPLTIKNGAGGIIYGLTSSDRGGQVDAEVNRWAAGQKYSADMIQLEAHDTHFHVHIDRDAGQPGYYGSQKSSSPDCCK